MATVDEIQAARFRLTEAVADLDLTAGERRFVDWLARWDVDTMDHFIGVVRKARKS